ncbi:MAG TPA: manganese efflux pump MntP family protein [Methylophilaceae bacterium]|nr:manganese efflux pump MntP family protein [Methylophilaceae bacterium]
MIEVLTLAVALSMDAFAISIGLSSKQRNKTLYLALLCGVYFGLFQALMPIIGYMGGKGVMGWVESYSRYIAFVLLLAVGGKLIYESFAEGIEEDIASITHRVMLTLAIATSIDALAAGFTLTLLDVNPLLACMIIGITTFLFSFAGVYVGNKSGTLLESKAELLGGVILVLISFKILLA